MSTPLVDIKNLSITFNTPTGPARVVHNLSLSFGKEKMGIVGESGSGKSLTARALMKLLPSSAKVQADTLRFGEVDLRQASEKTMQTIRGRRVGFILQDPKYSLNPVKTIGEQIRESWLLHKKGSKKAATEAVYGLLEKVKIRDPKRVAESYPHEISGGMGQRVMIAMMIVADPELLIADEPTSALDASVQAEILRLIDDLVCEKGMGLMLISHDLNLVASFCDRVTVMYMGRVMEEIQAKNLHQATHPYTQGLLNCMPSLLHPKAILPTLQRDDAWITQ